MRPVVFGAAVAVLLGSLAASPAPAPAPVGGGMVMNGYTIETQTTNWNMNSGDFTMPKEVKVSRPGSDARGDKARGNTKRGTAVLEGNVVVHDSGGAPEAREVGPDYHGPATITCDTLTIDSKTRLYDANGNVKFVQGDRVGTAQHATLNQTAHTLKLEGDVVLSEGQTSMRGNVVNYNLQTRDVVAEGAPVIIREPIPGDDNASAATPKPKATPRRR